MLLGRLEGVGLIPYETDDLTSVCVSPPYRNMTPLRRAPPLHPGKKVGCMCIVYITHAYMYTHTLHPHAQTYSCMRTCTQKCIHTSHTHTSDKEDAVLRWLCRSKKYARFAHDSYFKIILPIILFTPASNRNTLQNLCCQSYSTKKLNEVAVMFVSCGLSYLQQTLLFRPNCRIYVHLTQ